MKLHTIKLKPQDIGEDKLGKGNHEEAKKTKAEPHDKKGTTRNGSTEMKKKLNI